MSILDFPWKMEKVVPSNLENITWSSSDNLHEQLQQNTQKNNEIKRTMTLKEQYDIQRATKFI